MKIFCFLFLIVGICYSAGNLYAVMQTGPNLNFGILDLTTAKLSKVVAKLPGAEVISTTSSRTMVGTEDGVFHIGVENLNTGAPGLFTVIVADGTSKMVELDQTCLLYQLNYDEEAKILYGMNVQDKDDATLFTIDLDTGTTNVIGTFPLHINAKLKKRSGDCYEILGGATILDSDTKVLYLYYSDGDGLYYEEVDVRSANVLDHGNFEYDLASAVFGDTYEYLYAIDIGVAPDYLKSFVTYDLLTNRITRQNAIPYWAFYDNESAYVSDKKLYSTIMMKNISSTVNSLISIDINTGDVVYEPSYSPSNIIWGMKYADF